MSNILLADWSVDFAMDDEREKSKWITQQMDWQVAFPLWILEGKN